MMSTRTVNVILGLALCAHCRSTSLSWQPKAKHHNPKSPRSVRPAANNLLP